MQDASVSGLVAQGLIVQRDSLAGPFTGLTGKIHNLSQTEEENIDYWSPQVRADVLDFMLQSPIRFSRAQQTVDIEDYDEHGNLQTAPVERTLFGLWYVAPPAVAPQATPVDDPVTGAPLPLPPHLQAYRLAQITRPTRACFNTQMRFLDGYAALRKEREAEIITQIEAVMPYLGSVVGLRLDRHRWTVELLDAVWRLSRHVVMRYKAALACRRPVELSPQVQPMIATPAHSAFPSGHATESFAMATVLNAVVRLGHAYNDRSEDFATESGWRDFAQMLSMVAARIAINRTVAGLHYPVDSASGTTLGVTLGNYVLWRCGAPTVGPDGEPKVDPAGRVAYRAWAFDSWGYDGYEDYRRAEQVTTAGAEIALRESVAHQGPTDPASGKRLDIPFQYRLVQDAEPDFIETMALREIFQRAVGEWD